MQSHFFLLVFILSICVKYFTKKMYDFALHISYNREIDSLYRIISAIHWSCYIEYHIVCTTSMYQLDHLTPFDISTEHIHWTYLFGRIPIGYTSCTYKFKLEIGLSLNTHMERETVETNCQSPLLPIKTNWHLVAVGQFQWVNCQLFHFPPNCQWVFNGDSTGFASWVTTW